MENKDKSFKLTPEELSSINSIRQNFNEITFSLGQNMIENMNLNNTLKLNIENKEKIISTIDDIKLKEKELLNQLKEKYGNGNIDLATGVITLDEKPNVEEK